MRKILALDAGGTSSRAVLIDASGACSGFGRAGGGNPTAVGTVAAVDALGLAVERAIDDGRVTSAGSDSLVVIALAGTATTPFITRLETRLSSLGLSGRIVVEPDLLGTFCSGTARKDGFAVIAGTGTIAARVVDAQIHTVKGGSGWLLGDTGSGFWIGRQVARAVVASLDGLGPSTGLTQRLLDATGIERTRGLSRGRPEELARLMTELYALRPVELARFAPLAFDLVDTANLAGAEADDVAHDILDTAAAGIAGLLSAAIEAGASGGIVVLGGGVLAAGLSRAPAIFVHRLRAAAEDAEFIPVQDGVVGAAVLAFRHLGREVDAVFHRQLSAEIARVRGAAPPS
ncbi:MAG: BadF/BadG/BcrA/BcrD ATPase family protein [Actinomycetota bacterium]